MATMEAKGNITRDLELRNSSSGDAMTFGTIGVSCGWGQNKKTLFLRFKAFKKTAEFMAKDCHKGSPVWISGNVDVDQWNDKNTGQQCSEIAVIVNDWHRVDYQRSGQQAQPATAPYRVPSEAVPPQAPPPFPAAPEGADDNIPF